jgi:hypothetical protein
MRLLTRGSVVLSRRRELSMTSRPDSPARLSLERDVGPMFRDKDHDSMLKGIDLLSCSDVGVDQDSVLSRLRDSATPWDGAWPPELRRWMADGAG